VRSRLSRHLDRGSQRMLNAAAPEVSFDLAAAIDLGKGVVERYRYPFFGSSALPAGSERRTLALAEIPRGRL